MNAPAWLDAPLDAAGAALAARLGAATLYAVAQQSEAEVLRHLDLATDQGAGWVSLHRALADAHLAFARPHPDRPCADFLPAPLAAVLAAQGVRTVRDLAFTPRAVLRAQGVPLTAVRAVLHAHDRPLFGQPPVRLQATHLHTTGRRGRRHVVLRTTPDPDPECAAWLAHELGWRTRAVAAFVGLPPPTPAGPDLVFTLPVRDQARRQAQLDRALELALHALLGGPLARPTPARMPGRFTAGERFVLERHGQGEDLERWHLRVETTPAALGARRQQLAAILLALHADLGRDGGIRTTRVQGAPACRGLLLVPRAQAPRLRRALDGLVRPFVGADLVDFDGRVGADPAAEWTRPGG